MTGAPFYFRFMVLALFSVLFDPAAGHADVVGPPPASCPVGSTPSSSHSGPLCRPEAACTMDLMCSGGEACEEVRLCVVQVACGGLMPPDAGPCFLDNVVGNCTAEGTCATGTCVVQNACITPGSASGGCACNVMQRSHPMLPLLMVGALGLALGYRRRR